MQRTHHAIHAEMPAIGHTDKHLKTSIVVRPSDPCHASFQGVGSDVLLMKASKGLGQPRVRGRQQRGALAPMPDLCSRTKTVK